MNGPLRSLIDFAEFALETEGDRNDDGCEPRFSPESLDAAYAALETARKIIRALDAYGHNAYDLCHPDLMQIVGAARSLLPEKEQADSSDGSDPLAAALADLEGGA